MDIHQSFDPSRPIHLHNNHFHYLDPSDPDPYHPHLFITHTDEHSETLVYDRHMFYDACRDIMTLNDNVELESNDPDLTVIVTDNEQLNNL